MILKDVNISQLLFDNAPVWVQTVLSILTMGLFLIGKALYRTHRGEVQEMKERMDRFEQRLDDIYHLLVKEARNDPADIQAVRDKPLGNSRSSFEGQNE